MTLKIKRMACGPQTVMEPFFFEPNCDGAFAKQYLSWVVFPYITKRLSSLYICESKGIRGIFSSVPNLL
jgi:hypothetical protein